MLVFMPIALAGSVEVQTTAAAEVHLNGVEILRTYGPSTALLSDIPTGEQIFVVYRAGEGSPIEVMIPEDGIARIRIGESTLETDQQSAAAEGPPPQVTLRSADGQAFAITVDGHRLGTLSPEEPMSLNMLPVGAHILEVRSTDMLTVWLRGSLVLQPGDELRLDLSEGRMAEVFGRAEAWQPGS